MCSVQGRGGSDGAKESHGARTHCALPIARTCWRRLPSQSSKARADPWMPLVRRTAVGVLSFLSVSEGMRHKEEGCILVFSP